MLTDNEKIILEKVRTVRDRALAAARELDKDGIAHALSEHVAVCDTTIAELEARAALP